MKMTKIISAAVIIVAAGIFASCHGKKDVAIKSTYAYSSFETTCMGTEGDGSQTLRAWGRGQSKGDAIEQAKKQAVYDVIFTGIRGGKGCEQQPLVTEVNARERYANYFDPFFSDGGEYKKFVKEESAGDAQRIQAAGPSAQNWGIVCTVDRPKLRQQLIKDGVLAAR